MTIAPRFASTSELSDFAFATVKQVVIGKFGRAAFLLLRPFLPGLITLGIELIIGVVAPPLLPVLPLIEGLLLPHLRMDDPAVAMLVEVVSLLKTPRSSLSPAVLQALPPA